MSIGALDARGRLQRTVPRAQIVLPGWGAMFWAASLAPPHCPRFDRSRCAVLLFITENMAAWCDTRSSTSPPASPCRVNNSQNAARETRTSLPYLRNASRTADRATGSAFSLLHTVYTCFVILKVIIILLKKYQQRSWNRYSGHENEFRTSQLYNSKTLKILLSRDNAEQPSFLRNIYSIFSFSSAWVTADSPSCRKARTTDKSTSGSQEAINFIAYAWSFSY